MDGKLRVKTEKEGKRLVKALTKPQTRAKVEAEIPGAMDLIEKLQKDVAALKKKVAGHEKIIQKLWVWKMEQEKKNDIS